VGGSNLVGDLGDYGAMGVPGAANLPPNRYAAASWLGSNGRLWLLGGVGKVNGNTDGYLNDLWQFQLPATTAATTPAAAPTFSAPAGTYSAPLTVSIHETTPGAAIHYTTNGTTPTATSATYIGPLKVSAAITLKAIALAPGLPASPLASATYTILKAQTVSFVQPFTSVTYGDKPITLLAKSSSGLPVTFALLSGPAKLSGSTLTLTGAETVVVVARQAGNATYAPAKQVEVTIPVQRANLTVTAANVTMKAGATVAKLSYAIEGLKNSDTQANSVTGAPVLKTTATSKSKPGTYPITMSLGTLASPKYKFYLTGATLQVTP
jgi:hypothetical protein